MNDSENGKQWIILLQPIKDLAKNWEIDLGRFLDDFLVRTQKVAMEDGKYNFANAAVALQGSVGVYERKVDYVYGVAVSFFGQIGKLESSKKGINNRVGEEDKEDEVKGTNEDTPNEAFKATDDLCELIDFSDIRLAEERVKLPIRKMKQVKRLQQVPVEMLPLLEEEKLGPILYSSNNRKEVIGSREDYVVNTCLFRNGAILLSESFKDEDFEEGVTSEDVQPAEQFSREQAGRDILETDTAVGAFGEMKVSQTADVSEGGETAVTQRDKNELMLISNLPLLANAAVKSKEDGDQMNELMADENSNLVAAGGDEISAIDTNAEKDGAWIEREVLDFFTPLHYCHAPVKIVKPYRDLDVELKRERRRRRKLGLPEQQSLFEYLNIEVFSKGVKRYSHRTVVDAARVFLASQIKQEWRKWTATKEAAEKEEHCSELQLDPDEDELLSTSEAEFADDNSDDSDGQPVRSFGEILKDKQIELEERPFCWNFTKNDVVGTSSSGMEAHYSEVVMAKLREYWEKGEETRSALSQRVQKWEEKLQPILEEEENRRKFDLPEYGADISDAIRRTGEGRSFTEVLADIEGHHSIHEWDVSRYFLSSLVNVNEGNLCFSMPDDENDNRFYSGDDIFCSLPTQRLTKEDAEMPVSVPFNLPTTELKEGQ